MSFSKILYQTLCVFSQIKDSKHIVKDFHSVARVGLGAAGGGGVKNFSVGICDGAPSTAGSSFYLGGGGRHEPHMDPPLNVLLQAL